MSEILFRYERVDLTSWAYLSALLMLALYFKFNRIWSVRNVDVIGIIFLAPGLLLVDFCDQNPDALPAAELMWIRKTGFAWLFGVGILLVVRLLLDSSMVRRPLLEPNLSFGGLLFLGICLFLFLMANVLNGPVGEVETSASRFAGMMAGEEEPQPESPPETQTEEAESEDNTFDRFGPGMPFLFLLPHISTRASTEVLVDSSSPQTVGLAHRMTVRVMAVLSNLLILLGMLHISGRHFDNSRTGVAAATLYLLLPYTALRTGVIPDALAAALLVWAVASYRRPYLSGICLGLAISVIYYPIFLLPLWISFYWRRGLGRFLVGIGLTMAAVILALAITVESWDRFVADLTAILGVRFPIMSPEKLGGIWQFWTVMYRLPVLAVFLAVCFGMAFWPAQKNLAVLISGSAAIMLGTQFWHPRDGGLAMAWYLPLTLLTVFRPNLEDRLALAVVSPRRRDRKLRDS